MTILSETTAFARSLLSRSLLRFGMVGSSATLCYLWAGHLLVSWARWPAPAAHGLAGLPALLAAYAGHCFWTFGIRGGDHARMLPRFVLVQGTASGWATCSPGGSAGAASPTVWPCLPPPCRPLSSSICCAVSGSSGPYAP